MKLTEYRISRLKPSDRRYDVTDDEIRNLVITVYASGKKSWTYRYRLDNKSKRHIIGDASAISPVKARHSAKVLAGQIATGIDPNQAKADRRKRARKAKEGTLRAFLDSRWDAAKVGHPKRQNPQ